MKLKLLSTLLISASVLASGPVFAGAQGAIEGQMAAKPTQPAATPAPKKVKKAKKAMAAPAVAAKGSQATITGGTVSGSGAVAAPAAPSSSFFKGDQVIQSPKGADAAAPAPAAK